MAGRLSLFGRGGNPAQDLYFSLVGHARQPGFYRDCGVPDTVDGRYDMIVLHAVLLFRRMRAEPEEAEFADQLFEVLVADLDRSLREMGQGDMSVGKRVRQMARGFYGRAESYDRALDGAEDLENSLRRNLFGTVEPAEEHVAAMAAYVRSAVEQLERVTAAQIRAAEPGFPPPPVPAGGH